jgi:hypothetical protein
VIAKTLHAACVALLFLFLCFGALGQVISRCGVFTVDRETLASIRERTQAQGLVSRRVASVFRSARELRVEIPIAFHVITDGSVGRVSNEQLRQQVELLNTAYASSGFSFVLRSRETVDRPEWFLMEPDGQAEQDAKQELGVRTDRALNIYVANSSYLGYARWPWELASKPALDGVVIRSDTLPVRDPLAVPYSEWNLGMTAVHEVGHWLGLLHTFDTVDPRTVSGCDPGDEVADTPATAMEHYGPSDLDSACPVSVFDTCPEMPGSDPIDNYMEYSADRCLTHFTVGQAERMLTMVRTYRASLIDNAALERALDSADALQ